ncbi:MAG: insulinase family protein [Bacteroidetes bacterium]|nr:insulinase family protein [Bacteroidota bacterium]
MKKLILSIIALSTAASVWAQAVDRSIRPKPGPAPEIKLGETKSFTLDNGLKVFVVENHKLPTVSCDIQFDIKPELQGDMTGYKEMMSELLTSGTKTRSNDQLNKEIDFIGANIRASDDEISGGGLKKHMNKIMELMSDIAMNADFKQSELDKIKKRTLSELETEKNQPDAMLANLTSVLNYGNKHPYGEVPTEESVSKITLERCKKYYSTYFRPNVAYMAIVGDITLAEAKPLVEKYFGKWQKGDVPAASYVVSYPMSIRVNKVAIAPRDGAVQSVVNVTYPIYLRPGTDDVIPARVANTILGGGSQGRLFLDLREKHAWTYGSYSSLKDDDLVGNFTANVKCRNAVTDSAVGAVLDEMKRLQTEDVSAEDLQNSISYISGNFAIGLESPERVAQYAINIERYHMPKDYYQNYLKKLSAVTAADVKMMATRYIVPDNCNIIVVGSKDVAPSLEKYASSHKVDFYDNYGSKVEMTAAKAAPAGVTAADILKKYVNAVGGEKAISNVKDVKTVATGEVQGFALTITEMKKSSSKFKSLVEASMNGNKMTLQKEVFNGTSGYSEAQGQKKNMEGDDLESAKQSADLVMEMHPEKYGMKYTLKGIESVNGSDAYVLESVSAKGKKATSYFDVKNGLLVKKVETGEGPQGPATQTVEYSDYKEVPGSGGYKIAYTVKILGQQPITAKVQTAVVNTNIPDTEFQ